MPSPSCSGKLSERSRRTARLNNGYSSAEIHRAFENVRRPIFSENARRIIEARHSSGQT
jgi:hypothetical protein